MQPTVGRIVHVNTDFGDGSEYCSAAIVSFDVREVASDEFTFMASVFNGRNPAIPVTLSFVSADGWHDPKECPSGT